MATHPSSVAHPLPSKGTMRGHAHRHSTSLNRILMEKQWVKPAPQAGMVMLLGMSPGLGSAVQALHGGHADLLLVALHPVVQLLVELGEAGVMRNPPPCPTTHPPLSPIPVFGSWVPTTTLFSLALLSRRACSSWSMAV